MAAAPTPDDREDALFSALAHRDRRRILDLLRASPGCNVSELAGHFTSTRVAVIKHLEVLERAGLVVSERRGRERRLYFNVVPIEEIWRRWADEYRALWARRLLDLKDRVERGGEDDERSTREGRVPGSDPRHDGRGVARADEDR